MFPPRRRVCLTPWAKARASDYARPGSIVRSARWRPVPGTTVSWHLRGKQKIGCSANVERQRRRPPKIGNNGVDVLVAYEQQQIASRPAWTIEVVDVRRKSPNDLNRSRATRDMRVASETDDAGCRQSGGIALRVSPRCHPGTRKVVGATGFEPATPCAQGRNNATAARPPLRSSSACRHRQPSARVRSGERISRMDFRRRRGSCRRRLRDHTASSGAQAVPR